MTGDASVKQPSLLELAKQSDPYAIAALLNRALHPKGILAKVALMDDCLHILVEATEVPSRQMVVAQIRKGVLRLQPDAITSAMVYGRCAGDGEPAWTHQLEFIPEEDVAWATDPDNSVFNSSSSSSAQVAESPIESAPLENSNPTPPPFTDSADSRSSNEATDNTTDSSTALSVHRISTDLVESSDSFANKSDDPVASHRPWYEWDITIAAMLIVFFPVGLYLMWRGSRWPIWLKFPITCLWIGLFIVSAMT